ncbi:hypothetical protein ABTZ03_08545 [Kitasatospora sp. NPDC096077]|uniref:hypothetical protein n=1 Tax=Kitasatospora sp. NPDC096077 TaxID=3155544 RepID=UPI0033306122
MSVSDDRSAAGPPEEPYRADGPSEPAAEEPYGPAYPHIADYSHTTEDPYGSWGTVEDDELADLDDFLRVCAELTGFDVPELRATGMADEHHRTALSHRVRDEHALVHLWYVGSWPGEAPSSARAHDRGLVWRTFRAVPPGSAAPGHGSWAEAPGGAEARREGEER